MNIIYVNTVEKEINSRALAKLMALCATDEEEMCFSVEPPSGFVSCGCTRKKGHSGVHVAHGVYENPVAVWR